MAQPFQTELTYNPCKGLGPKFDAPSKHISIQGSSTHYSTPRQDAESATAYTHMEVKVETLNARAIADELFGDYSVSPSIYAYVPVELIQQALNRLDALEAH